MAHTQEQKKNKSRASRPTEKPREAVDLSPFITNLDGNVYGVTNLPEEFVAVLFAWVSRSPKSFKELLREALEKGHVEVDGRTLDLKPLSERAAQFHEKWTVNYGHSSVAEHAVAHVGIEKVSRLASAELELSNEFLSITEYSQRYQQPKRGDWYNPIPKDDPRHERFELLMNECYDAFEQLIEGVYNHLKDKDKDALLPASLSESTKRDVALRKLAFEDARYVLPLAMFTNLGMTANGRAWRDGIVKLYNSDFAEVHQLADNLKQEISKILPTLLKHAEPSEYMAKSKARIKHRFTTEYFPDFPEVSYVGLQKAPSERHAMVNIIAQVLVQEQGLRFREALARARTMSESYLVESIQDLLWEMGTHDVPPEMFKQVDYQAELLISEASWHQLLRHNRKTNFVFSRPSANLGITVPPRIQEAGLEDIVYEVAEKAKALYDILELGYREYCVLNCHRRRIVAHFNLWEAYHLINLRTSEQAQWDIRETFESLYQQLLEVHPTLISLAKRR
ncbi:FAD-dependent thymidylate synthase [Alicyclobacillus shizuokensis]|uniref:FAD-dependent thymidylate synthase n=1 Tax=Alicyclobacillus shizuokensis TaxID=392014 RepID=UPI00082F9AF1|nr:FAD-dependent thymidylate synthase [Alicyclobacillus shizuokensis]